MTFRKLWLENYKDMNGGEVVMGNNVAYEVVGIGSMTEVKK